MHHRACVAAGGPNRGGLFDPAMNVSVAALRVGLGGSLRVIQRHLADVWRVRTSLGALKEAVFVVTVALAPASVQIREAVEASPAVHADETGQEGKGIRP